MGLHYLNFSVVECCITKITCIWSIGKHYRNTVLADSETRLCFLLTRWVRTLVLVLGVQRVVNRYVVLDVGRFVVGIYVHCLVFYCSKYSAITVQKTVIKKNARDWYQIRAKMFDIAAFSCNTPITYPIVTETKTTLEVNNIHLVAVDKGLDSAVATVAVL